MFVSMKRVLITGITGQDGSYLAEFLLKKDYQVFGLARFSRTGSFENIRTILPDIKLYDADLIEYTSLVKIIEQCRPDEVYNFASVSFVPSSWHTPVLAAEVNAVGVTRLLDAICMVNSKIKFYQASSSEMFGHVVESPQNESTPFRPISPYAVAKLYAHHITQTYREAYKIPASCGIAFNHESPRRGPNFVTRKVTRGAAEIKLGISKELRMGNLEAKRDWGYAPDYVEAMWLMLQQPEPDDYVIATGKTHSVEELLECAFSYIERPWQEHVRQDPKLYRPTDLHLLLGDATKIKQKLNWAPKKSFEAMIHEMVEHDLSRLK